MSYEEIANGKVELAVIELSVKAFGGMTVRTMGSFVFQAVPPRRPY